MRVVLSVLSYVAFVLALPFLLTHPKLRRGFKARLGLYPKDLFRSLGRGPRIWLHGASAGDVLALLPLARELKARRPDIRLVLTTITNSGLAMAERNPGIFAAVTYFPYDVPGAVDRALGQIRPDVLVLEYTELWPQLIHAARRQGVRLVLHNGRFSAERLNRYRWLFAVTGNLLHLFTLLLVRDEAEAERATRLGAATGAIHVTGNTKFDNLGRESAPGKVEELRRAASFSAGSLVWVAGSTHEGEEEHLLDVFTELRRDFPALRLVIAPRYVERVDAISALATRCGLRARRRSRAGGDCDVLILDTIGELAACYALADVVFVGGSFVRRGGQNILEPAACGKPVLFGPHMENFADSVQVLLGRGGLQVASPSQLVRVAAELLGREPYRRELGEMARAQVTRVRGTAARNAELIVGLI